MGRQKYNFILNLGLPPYSFTPLRTSQVAVYIHVCPRLLSHIRTVIKVQHNYKQLYSAQGVSCSVDLFRGANVCVCLCVYVIRWITNESRGVQRLTVRAARKSNPSAGVCLPWCCLWCHVESRKFLWDLEFWRQRSQQDNLSYYVWKPIFP